MLKQVDKLSLYIHGNFCDHQIVNYEAMVVVVRPCEIAFGIGSYKVCR